MKIIRIVLLAANGAYLLLAVIGVVALLQARDVLSLLAAIGLLVLGFLLAGNVAYIWRCPPRTKHASDRQLIETF